MLNRHPSIWLCHETRFGFKVLPRRGAFGDLSVTSNRRLLVDRYLETIAARGLGYPPDRLADVLMREGTSYKALFTALIQFGALEKGRTRFGEKTPGHALISEMLCEWFPDCTLIHIIRDPRDVVASLQRVPFGSKCVASNTRTWMNHVSGAEASNHRENFLRVQYEHLVKDPESVLRQVLTKVGEEYTPRMLAADDSVESSEWWFNRAQGPLENNRIEKWRSQLGAKDAGIVEWLAGDEMEKFDYTREMDRISFLTRIVAIGSELYDRILVRLAHLPTLWYYWIKPTELASEDRAWAKRTTRNSSMPDNR